jgi:hypothetical protein
VQKLIATLVAALFRVSCAALAAYMRDPLAIWKTALKTAGLEPQ